MIFLGVNKNYNVSSQDFVYTFRLYTIFDTCYKLMQSFNPIKVLPTTIYELVYNESKKDSCALLRDCDFDMFRYSTSNEHHFTEMFKEYRDEKHCWKTVFEEILKFHCIDLSKNIFIYVDTLEQVSYFINNFECVSIDISNYSEVSFAFSDLKDFNCDYKHIDKHNTSKFIKDNLN